MIAIVDYRAGNLTSVCRAFSAIGAEARIVRAAAETEGADAIVVPGVGHFGATAALGEEWRSLLRRWTADGLPLLGICLGMQWLYEASDEAPGCPGLGLLPGSCRRLSGGPGGERVKVPHVGWNALEPVRASRALAGLGERPYVYFTHSYLVPVAPEAAAVTVHGERFAAIVERGALWGVQFHPEKSGDVGLQILRNFLSAVGIQVGRSSIRANPERA